MYTIVYILALDNSLKEYLVRKIIILWGDNNDTR